jgi:hypothetical protein
MFLTRVRAISSIRVFSFNAAAVRMFLMGLTITTMLAMVLMSSEYMAPACKSNILDFVSNGIQKRSM